MTRVSLPSATRVPTPVGVKKPPMPAPARADALGEGALRHQLDLDLRSEELPLELLVLAHVGGDHLADLPLP